MRIYRIIAVALAAAFIAASASAQNKGALQRENAQLKYVIDSLKAEMEKVRAELKYTDSVANEMLSIYYANESGNSSKPAIEEYTAEISDSLLNLW